MKNYLIKCRAHFIYTGLFSLFVNILTLTVSIYMLQVFDRVFASRSVETLVMLTIIAIAALLVMMALDILRGRLLQAAGIDLDAALGPRVLANLLDRSAKGGPLNEASLRDVATVRGFLTGQGIIALFDTPWLPFYLFVIYLFHPLLGVAAIVATLLLFLLAWANEKLTHGHIEKASKNAKHAARFIDTSLRNAEVVSALGMLPMVTHKWRQLNAKVTDAQIVAGRLAGLVMPPTISSITPAPGRFTMMRTVAARGPRCRSLRWERPPTLP